MTTLKESITLFGDRMYSRFVEKSPKHPDGDWVKNFDIESTPINYLRDEISYHYQKWLEASIIKPNSSEANALLDMCNMAFALYVKITDGD